VNEVKIQRCAEESYTDWTTQCADHVIILIALLCGGRETRKKVRSNLDPCVQKLEFDQRVFSIHFAYPGHPQRASLGMCEFQQEIVGEIAESDEHSLLPVSDFR
jgi:hypothetical protein